MIVDHFYFHEIVFQQSKIPDNLTRKQPFAIISLISRIFISFLQPNVWFIGKNYTRYNPKYEVELKYNYNSLMMVFCTLRIFFIVECYLINSKYFSPESKRTCEINKTNNSNLFFTLKAYMHGSSTQVYTFLFLVFFFFFTISVRNFEMPLDEYSGKHYSRFSDVLWSIIITMLTVGYGDVYPSTLEGRALSITSSMIGIMLNSMLMVTITNLVNFEGNEKIVFDLLERLELKDQQKTLSYKMIRSYCKLYKALKHAIPNESLKEKLRERFMVVLLKYEDNNKEIDNSFPSMTNLEILNDEIEYINNSMNTNKINSNDVKEQIDKLIESF